MMKKDLTLRGYWWEKAAYGLRLLLAVVLALSAIPALGQIAKPPVAAKRPYPVKGPDGVEPRIDNYYWLRDDTRKNPEMLGYLAAENSYADAMLAPAKARREKLYSEMVSRLKKEDSTAAYRLRGYMYYSRVEDGKQFPILVRRKGDMNAPEEVILDQNIQANGKAYFFVGENVVSPDNMQLAWAEDVVGRQQFRIRVKDLRSGSVLADEIENVEPFIVWADDNRTIFYLSKDPITLIGNRVMAHVLGTPVSTDRLIYKEADETYKFSLGRTASNRYLCFYLESTTSREQRCASASNPATFDIFSPRQPDTKYLADNVNGRWIIQTNWNAPNYRLMVLADSEPLGDRARWRELVPQKPGVFIEKFAAFDSFTAIEERRDGNKRIRMIASDGSSRDVKADEPAYVMALDVNREAQSEWVRYSYDSLVTPRTIYEVNAMTGERRLLKQDIFSGYDPIHYVTERVWAPARDGARIPVSLVYRKGFVRDGKAALVQYGYGAYGISSDPVFRSHVVSLLDRGVVYAIAHIRGGQELGREWYDGGHLKNKKNSFTDFIDVTRFLVKQRYAAKARVAAFGGSAGGLLMGAVANMAPQDYRAIVAAVPFVDIVTTMLDASIPLTTFEYDEWGNPGKREDFVYMMSYSPYDNVSAQNYPAMYILTGLYDSQVQYYEPAKWVAKLRATKTDNNPLLFRINLQAGHRGKSGRYAMYEDVSEYYAFILDQLGVAG